MPEGVEIMLSNYYLDRPSNEERIESAAYDQHGCTCKAYVDIKNKFNWESEGMWVDEHLALTAWQTRALRTKTNGRWLNRTDRQGNLVYREIETRDLYCRCSIVKGRYRNDAIRFG